MTQITNESISPSLGNPKDSLPIEIVKLATYATCALFGVIGNILVIVILIRLRGNRTRVVDFYLKNLAIADLGFLLLTFPIGATRERVPLNWPFGEFVCLFLQPFAEIFHGASVWCIAVTAFERYQKISRPSSKLHVNRRPSLKRTKTVAACIWVASFFVYSFPLYFVLSYSEIPGGGTSCGPKWPTWDSDFVLPRVYVVLTTLFSYIFPLVVISWTFLAVSRKLNESNKFIKDMKNETDHRGLCTTTRTHALRLVQNRRAKRILTPVVLVFAISMFPLSMLRLCVVAWPPISTQTFYNNLFYVVLLCTIINSSANPVIYSLVRKDFRRELTRMFCANHSRRSRSYSLSQAFVSIELGLFRFSSSQMENNTD